MIDSHCHLDHEPLINNISEVLRRSKNVGIKKILTICTTLKSFESIKKILKLDDIIYGTFGIHPHETDSNHVSKKIILVYRSLITFIFLSLVLLLNVISLDFLTKFNFSNS